LRTTQPQEGIDLQLREMDERVTYARQFQEDTEPTVLISHKTLAGCCTIATPHVFEKIAVS
jgi:hypothetical protein